MEAEASLVGECARASWLERIKRTECARLWQGILGQSCGVQGFAGRGLRSQGIVRVGFWDLG